MGGSQVERARSAAVSSPRSGLEFERSWNVSGPRLGLACSAWGKEVGRRVIGSSSASVGQFSTS